MTCETDNNTNAETDTENKEIYSYDEAEELCGHGKYNYLLLATCSLITSACAFDMFAYATVVAAASCDLNLDFTKIGILVSAPFAGVLFAFPWGYYADTQGRKRAMLLSTSVGFVFAVISAFSTHWLFMLVIKIIGCSFSTASFTLTMAFLGEGIGDKYRRQFLFIMSSVNNSSEFFSFGLAWLILPLDFRYNLPLINTTFRPWRLYTIVLALPLAIGGLLLQFLYESPKYLVGKGDYKNALEVLTRIYERNGGKRKDYPVKQICKTDAEINSTKPSFLESLRQQTVPIFKPPLLWRTLQLFFLMALCCTTNNTFFMWYPTMVNYFFNSMKAVENAPRSFCERMFGEDHILPDTQTFKCKEEISIKTLYSGMLYSFFYLVVSFSTIKVSTRPRLLLILVLFVSGASQLLLNVKNPIANIIFFTLLHATALGIGCISTYFVDLYPTANRGLVASLSMMVARLCALMGVNLVGSIITKHCEATFYVWSVFVFAGIGISLFLPPDRKSKDSATNLNP